MAKDPTKRIAWTAIFIPAAVIAGLNVLGIATRSPVLHLAALPTGVAIGAYLFRRHQVQIRRELAKTPLPPNVGVLYLRAFSGDDEVASVFGIRLKGGPFWWGPTVTVEMILTQAFAKIIAPVVAFGEPKEELPDIGAHRVYVQSNQDWQTEVRSWAERCRVIVMRPGASSGVVWELEEVLKFVGKRVIVIVTYRPPISVASKMTDGPVLDLVHSSLEKALGREVSREKLGRDFILINLSGEIEPIRAGWLMFIHGRFSAAAIHAAKRAKKIAN